MAGRGSIGEDGEGTDEAGELQDGYCPEPGAEPRALVCSSQRGSHPVALADFRGDVPTDGGPIGPDIRVEWLTSPVRSEQTIGFTWIGGSQVRPVRGAFPHQRACLLVNGEFALSFPLGVPDPFRVADGEFVLEFEPRRFQSLAQQAHRAFEPSGVSGLYRLDVPQSRLIAGEQVRLAVELEPVMGDAVTTYFVSPRTSASAGDNDQLRHEVARLQADLVELTKAVERLSAQAHADVLPARLSGSPVLIHSAETRHLHPATVTIMSDDEAVVTFREGADHLSPDGRLLICRSDDCGDSWTRPEVVFASPDGDHRAGPIFEAANGDWLTTDYDYGRHGYGPDGRRGGGQDAPTLWGAWSTDRGRSWSHSLEPLTVADSPSRYAEVERHMIQLASGELVVAANYRDEKVAARGRPGFSIAIFVSDDNGRSWHRRAAIEGVPPTEGEATLLQASPDRILLLARTSRSGGQWLQNGSLLQSESADGGRTWTPLRPTGMSSGGSPAHLLRLRDGRILCSHASRRYPVSIFVTTSEDEGRSWGTDRTMTVTDDLVNWDSCYPTSAQWSDGTVITAWYGSALGRYFIRGLRYPPGELP